MLKSASSDEYSIQASRLSQRRMARKRAWREWPKSRKLRRNCVTAKYQDSICRRMPLQICILDISDSSRRHATDKVVQLLEDGTHLVLVTACMAQDRCEMPNLSPDLREDYDSFIYEEHRCAIYFNKKVCKIEHVEEDRDFVFFKWERKTSPGDGITVGLKCPVPPYDLETLWMPWRRLRFPCILAMAGPTRNLLYAVAPNDTSDFKNKNILLRESKTQRIEDDPEPRLTMTAALGHAYLEVYHSSKSSLSAYLKMLPFNAVNTCPPTWTAEDTMILDNEADRQAFVQRRLGDLANLILAMVARQYPDFRNNMSVLHRGAKNAVAQAATVVTPDVEAAEKLRKIADNLCFGSYDIYKDLTRMMNNWKDHNTERRENFIKYMSAVEVPATSHALWTTAYPLNDFTLDSAPLKMMNLAQWFLRLAIESQPWPATQ